MKKLDQNNGMDNNSFEGKILIAEDNQINQLVITRILEKWKIKYQVVINGYEVINALDSAHFDLILMDCQMPGIDGYMTTKLIRKSKSVFKNIPIIALTANTEEGNEKKCNMVGMNEYLTKPINFTELDSILRKYLGGRS